MKLIKIRRAALATENMDTATVRFAILLKSKSPKERIIYCNNIQALLDECPLSDWFALYIRFIFRQIYQEPVASRDQFLDVISNLQLNKLSNEYHGLKDRVSLLESPKLSFFHNTYPDKEARDVLIKEKINRWKRIQTQSHEKQLGLYLLVQKIVLYVERMGILSEETTRRIIEKISEDKDLIGVVVEFVPILLELQKIAPYEPVEVVIPILERAIDLTLKLLGFDADNQHLVSLILDDIFKNQYVIIVDYIPEPEIIFDDSESALLCIKVCQ